MLLNLVVQIWHNIRGALFFESTNLKQTYPHIDTSPSFYSVCIIDLVFESIITFRLLIFHFKRV